MYIQINIQVDGKVVITESQAEKIAEVLMTGVMGRNRSVEELLGALDIKGEIIMGVHSDVSGRDKKVVVNSRAEYIEPRKGKKEELDRINQLEDALRELVEVKHIKDRMGKTPIYQLRQPKAWKRAEQLIKVK